ncbi:MAG: stage II sporulation protein M [Gemmatimonadaceae bacterium]
MTAANKNEGGIASARASGATSSLDVSLDVETPEQIALSYSIAGIGSRGAAAAIDALISVGALIVLGLILGFAASYTGMRLDRMSPSVAWVGAAYVIAVFVVNWGYYVIFEGIWDGQTPGKRIMKLRVVRDGGFSITFAASAVRNLLRVVDAFALYLVAIVIALTNRSRKRLGDIVAGTFVVKEEKVEAAALAPKANTVLRPQAFFARMTDEEYSVLERYMQRRTALEVSHRDAIVAQLAARFADYLPRGPEMAPRAALVRLYESEQGARGIGVAARSDIGAHREQHAIVALGLKRWNDFATVLGAASARGLSRMSPEEVSVLVSRYREMTTDLARLQTASRGRDTESLFYVSRLVAQGHNLLYQQRGRGIATAMKYLMNTVPMQVRRSWRPIGLAALMLFGPAAAAYVVVVREPAVASQLLPDEMISRAATGSDRERRGEGYVSIPEEIRPIAASSIISNNVTVTYLTFAMGLTMGVGTILMLVFNGVSIGSGVGLFASRGVAKLILAFIAPHGVLELSAICIAGGGGLLIAKGILLPGSQTRRDALVANGRRAIDLIAASTLLLLVAGTLEGLVSPRVWPLEWKLAISSVTAVIMLGYLSLGRTRTDAR